MGNNNNSPVAIQDYEIVSVITAGEEISVTYSKYTNTRATVSKIDKKHYRKINDESGEVFEIKNSTVNRGQSLKSVNKSLNELRTVINANTMDVKCCRWLTLTYSENMTDVERLMDDWGNLRKKMRRKWGDFEYINVKEPQERGAWHLHVLLIFDGTAPYMDNTKLSKMWGKGYVKITKVRDGFDNGLYFVISLKKKTRLSLYPTKTRIYNCSPGVKRPTKEEMTKAEADELVRDKRKVNQYTKIIKDANGKIINAISITRYRDKRCEYDTDT